MPDFDDLSSFTDGFSEGMNVNPLPASEVRRKGDRMRRRNTALATVGGVVAAAVVIGTPVALMNNGSNDRTDDPPIAGTPSGDAEQAWVTEIPTDFPVTDGMVVGDGEAAEGDIDAFDLCTTSYPTSRGTTDTQTWTHSDDGESSATRTFQLWPDDASADASVDALVQAVQDCPQQPTLSGEEVIESKLVDALTGGDRSVTFVQQVLGDDGSLSQLDTVQVTRVGNAVLVNSSYGAAGGDQAIDIAASVLENQSARTVAAMCVFSADPCAQGDDPSPSTDTSDDPALGTPIPAGFPLAVGLQDSGDSDVTGPGADVEGARVVDLCGTEVFATSQYLERSAANQTGPEYVESRELYTFVTADEPIEELTTVRDAVRDCARIEGEFYDWTTRTLDGLDDYDSVTWGYFADEGLDGAVFQITRVGSAILVVFEAGEMSESSLQPAADRLSEVTTTIVPEMCVFTEDGC